MENRISFANIFKFIKSCAIPVAILVFSLIFLVLIESLSSKNGLFSITTEAIITGLISGSVFYIFTVLYPAHTQKRIVINTILKRYIRVKKDMLFDLLSLVNKEDDNIINSTINNYLSIWAYLNKEDLDHINKKISDEMISDFVFYLKQLGELLINLNTYDFVKTNKGLYEAVQNSIYWNYQFQYYCDSYYRKNKRPELLMCFLDSFLFGGYYYDENKKGKKPNDKDDFIELLQTL